MGLMGCWVSLAAPEKAANCSEPGRLVAGSFSTHEVRSPSAGELVGLGVPEVSRPASWGSRPPCDTPLQSSHQVPRSHLSPSKVGKAEFKQLS